MRFPEVPGDPLSPADWPLRIAWRELCRPALVADAADDPNRLPPATASRPVFQPTSPDV